MFFHVYASASRSIISKSWLLQWRKQQRLLYIPNMIITSKMSLVSDRKLPSRHLGELVDVLYDGKASKRYAAERRRRKLPIDLPIATHYREYTSSYIVSLIESLDSDEWSLPLSTMQCWKLATLIVTHHGAIFSRPKGQILYRQIVDKFFSDSVKAIALEQSLTSLTLFAVTMSSSPSMVELSCLANNNNQYDNLSMLGFRTLSSQAQLFRRIDSTLWACVAERAIYLLDNYRENVPPLPIRSGLQSVDRRGVSLFKEAASKLAAVPGDMADLAMAFLTIKKCGVDISNVPLQDLFNAIGKTVSLLLEQQFMGCVAAETSHKGRLQWGTRSHLESQRIVLTKEADSILSCIRADRPQGSSRGMSTVRYQLSFDDLSRISSASARLRCPSLNMWRAISTPHLLLSDGCVADGYRLHAAPPVMLVGFVRALSDARIDADSLIGALALSAIFRRHNFTALQLAEIGWFGAKAVRSPEDRLNGGAWGRVSECLDIAYTVWEKCRECTNSFDPETDTRCSDDSRRRQDSGRAALLMLHAGTLLEGRWPRRKWRKSRVNTLLAGVTATHAGPKGLPINSSELRQILLVWLALEARDNNIVFPSQLAETIGCKLGQYSSNEQEDVPSLRSLVMSSTALVGSGLSISNDSINGDPSVAAYGQQLIALSESLDSLKLSHKTSVVLENAPPLVADTLIDERFPVVGSFLYKPKAEHLDAVLQSCGIKHSSQHLNLAPSNTQSSWLSLFPRKVAIIFLSHVDYYFNSPHNLVPTARLRLNLMREFGYTPVPLPHFVWSEDIVPLKRQRLLCTLIASVGHRLPEKVYDVISTSDKTHLHDETTEENVGGTRIMTKQVPDLQVNQYIAHLRRNKLRLIDTSAALAAVVPMKHSGDRSIIDGDIVETSNLLDDSSDTTALHSPVDSLKALHYSGLQFWNRNSSSHIVCVDERETRRIDILNSFLSDMKNRGLSARMDAEENEHKNSDREERPHLDESDWATQLESL